MSPDTENHHGGTLVAPDVLCLPLVMVNVCMVGADPGPWTLVDTGLASTVEKIRSVAQERFSHRPPYGIVLTHGHFDHIGAVLELSREWDVPVYAHQWEMPYLTGQADYPLADPTVGGGLLSLVSPLYPRRGIDLGERVRPLPADGSLPGMPGWRWLHTPGHTPGHVALFREADRILIAGDALTTVQQESALAVALQEKELHGPPAYFTTDWQKAGESVRLLEALEPSVVVSGHGRPMKGAELAQQLDDLAQGFDRFVVPDHGRYVPKDQHQNPGR